MYDFSRENVRSLDTKDFLYIMIGVENRVMIVLNIMKGMKTGSKYYVFNIGIENRVKIFREKTKENLGMKTWIQKFMRYVYPCHVIKFACYSNKVELFQFF